ncbi:MAG: hypothetical protein QOF30_140 [Acidimicrobiaceae bacterium]|nr:hypothetical protein [Acidimicrobiaceae bacterium]
MSAWSTCSSATWAPDWGDVDDNDQAANAEALATGGRLLSSYHLPTGHTYAVRRALAPVARRRLEELPEFARAVHRRAERQEACIPVTA